MVRSVADDERPALVGDVQLQPCWEMYFNLYVLRGYFVRWALSHTFYFFDKSVTHPKLQSFTQLLLCQACFRNTMFQCFEVPTKSTNLLSSPSTPALLDFSPAFHGLDYWQTQKWIKPFKCSEAAMRRAQQLLLCQASASFQHAGPEHRHREENHEITVKGSQHQLQYTAG